MGLVKKYFAGGNTAKGFVGYFDNIISPKNAENIFCIKGGPGVGKSTFMKKVADIFLKRGYDISLFFCPSDPNSLDGVLIDELKTAFIDGTSPHITDPVYPGAVDIILDFGNFFDSSQLKKNRQEIIELTDRVGEWFAVAKDKLKPAGVMLENLRRIYKKSESEKKVNIICNSISEELFGDKEGSCLGERKLFLSAITPDGTVNFANETLAGKKIINLESFSGDASWDIMSFIKEEAANKGFFTECFYCPLSPFEKIDHMIIPELNTAITVSNSYHLNELEGSFYDLSECYIKGLDTGAISKSLETLDKLISDCTLRLNKARALHSELESFYISAMDYKKAEAYTSLVLEKLKID